MAPLKAEVGVDRPMKALSLLIKKLYYKSGKHGRKNANPCTERYTAEVCIDAKVITGVSETTV